MKLLKVLCILFCLMLSLTVASCRKEDQIMENYPGLTDNKHIIKELSLEELTKKVSNKETYKKYYKTPKNETAFSLIWTPIREYGIFILPLTKIIPNCDRF